VLAWLSPFDSGKFQAAAVLFCVIFGIGFLSPSIFAQPQSKSSYAASTERSAVTRPFNLTAELQSRVQTLNSAKKSGDPTVISSASRAVLALALREMGDIELMRGSVEAAIAAYGRSRSFEDLFTTRTALAQAYFQAQRLDESLSVVTDVLVADPQNARAWYVQGKVWMTKKRYAYAVTSFSRVLNLQADPAAQYLLGAAFLQLRQYDQALTTFHTLLEGTGNHAEVHLLLAEAYRAANYGNDFAREIRKAGPDARPTEHNTSSPIDSIISRSALLGSSFETAKPTKGESEQIGRVQVELRTLLASALNDLGTAEARQQQYARALEHFHEAANWNPELPGLRRNTGIAAGRLADHPECIRALRPVVAETPEDNVARAMLGTALFATHSYADAAQVFMPLGDSVLQLHELAYSWAASLVYINRYGDAATLLTKLEQQTLSAETLMLVAQLWSQMGNYEHTVEVCHRALQLDPRLLRAHYSAGLALLRLDRSAESAPEFRDELELDENNVDAQFHLAFSLLQQSQNQQAVELWKKVLASKPDHAQANYELGKELRVEGKLSESISYLEAAVRLKPEFEPAHYQLQAAYRALGRKEDADREARVYQALKAKSRNITLPAPHQPSAERPD
jgi:tetratricopeptide (TPR) repeat protein